MRRCHVSYGLALAATLAVFVHRVDAGPFPSAGVDQTTSLGQFKIVVAKPFTNAVTGIQLNGGLAGYTYTDGILVSPRLFDSMTVIGRSGRIAPAPGGVTMPIPTAGYPNNTVSSIATANYSSIPAGFDPDHSTHAQVYTEILNLNLSDGTGNAVLAGNAAPPAAVGASIGQVQATDPMDDFNNAQSFFDIFAQINVNIGLGYGVVGLKNDQALVLTATGITEFPPKLLYIHNATTSQDVRFLADDPTGNGAWHAGDVFGKLIVAGHGISFKNTQGDIEIFDRQFRAISVPEPSSIVLAAIGGVGLVISLRRRNQKQ
ncbi:MAG: PEP-CTERM sorting domain-containing protein [Planctomycetota bacterium]|nr:PEP-CTERM sorting domain-containing protein [Planctomycetota bacterium]